MDQINIITPSEMASQMLKLVESHEQMVYCLYQSKIITEQEMMQSVRTAEAARAWHQDYEDPYKQLVHLATKVWFKKKDIT